LDFLGDFDRHSEQRRACDQRGSGDDHDHSNFGDDHRLSDINRHICGPQVIVDHTVVGVDRKWDNAAVRRDWELQRWQHAESDQFGKLEFVFEHGRDYRQ
jgi:hypothetical protein